VPEPWQEVSFRRVLYSTYDEENNVLLKFVEYYAFSMNGEPETDWKKVRLTLTLPTIVRCYYAKMQFSPRWVVHDVESIDREAEVFVRSFLPEVLKALPMPEDVN
jgi:hypothetical protein